MSGNYQHIIVMGAGAVGGYFGGRIAERTARNVTMIARGNHLDMLRSKGLTLRSKDGDTIVKPNALENPKDAGPADLVLFTVKSYDTDKAIEQIRPVVQKSTQILTLQNGIENYPRLVKAFGSGRVIQGLCRIGVGVPEAGVVEHTSMGEIVFGEPDGSESKRLTRLKKLFDESGIQNTLTIDIRHEVWIKFAWNCVFNMITAVSGVTIDHLFKHPESEALCRAVFDEVRLIAQQEGVILDKEDENRVIEPAKKLNGFVTSTLQDRQKGKKLEYDAFTGALVRRAEKHNLEIPYTSTIHALLTLIDNS